MHIAIAKPDWGIVGGFEVLLGLLVGHLESQGHSIGVLSADPLAGHGRDIDDTIRQQHPAYFDYVSLIEQFEALDASEFDLVISTQPGSWAVSHPKKLALFYHHQRAFYDLAEAFVEHNEIDPAIHRKACDNVRAIDRRHLDSVTHFLVPSQTVAERLSTFSGVDEAAMSPFHAGPVFGSDRSAPSSPTDTMRDTVICVSRSEATKRTQLFVAAAHEGFGAPAALAGGGGQLNAVRRYAAERAAGVATSVDPWNAVPTIERVEVTVPDVPVDVVGRLADDDLLSLYARSSCLVAPAFNEDYGLTVLEAFSHGVPVVVCADGGGLVEFVDDGSNGLVVEPDPAAIAQAVRSIVGDEARAAQMSKSAAATAEQFSWDHAFRQLDDALQLVATADGVI